jgi:hypothetical protein
MAVKRKVQLSQLTEESKDAQVVLKNGGDGVAALTRLVKYCEAEASDLKLSFVAYCLSIAKTALVEEFGPCEPTEQAEER